MSYSRRELGFVDDLTSQLEKAGFKVWLDYKALIPGSPWAAQIDKGLDESDAIVLVVSKSSIASQFVELEWRKVLNENKRIILAIFEAIDLPPELEKFEWVDFRGSYKKGLKKLISQLQTPIKDKRLAPKSGIKFPFVVWVTAALSALAGLYSLLAFWTALIPVVLVPLAWRVFKRDYNFQSVQSALWAMPFAVYVTHAFWVINVDVENSLEDATNIYFWLFFFRPAFINANNILDPDPAVSISGNATMGKA